MRKNIFLVLTLLVLGQISYGQHKIYNGTFNSLNFQGNAKYNYEEKPDSRLFSGPFIFKTSNSSINISGDYQNNMKNGPWKFVLTNVSNTDLIMKYVITANVSGDFDNGNLNGKWNLSRTKVISFSDNGISSYYQNNLNAISYLFDGKTIDTKKSTTVTEKCTATFRNNHFIANFSYSVNGGKSIVNGKFNDQGYFEGTWTVNYYQNGILNYQIRDYKNGVLLTIKNKDLSTGDVKTIYDKTVETNEFFQNYNATENSSKIGETYYTLVTGKMTEDNVTFLEDAIEIWYNNSSLGKSAYLFEIERGTNPMTIYPERIIKIDEEKTNEFKEEQQKLLAEERLKKEKQESLEREIQAAKEKQRREREQAELKKRKEFEESDYYQIIKEVKINFSVWAEKSQYETDEDYNNRIKNESDIQFQKSVESAKKKSIDKFLKRIYYGQLQEYDAENELFEIYFYKYTGAASMDTRKCDTILFKCPRNLAPQLKKYQMQNIYSYTYALTPYVILIPSDIKMVNNNWELSDALIVVGNACSEKAMIIEEKKEKYYATCYARSYNDPKLSYINNYKIKLESFEDLKQKSILPSEFYFNWSNPIENSDLIITQENLNDL